MTAPTLAEALRADIRQCLDDVATEFRARGRSDSRFVQLIARMDALLRAEPDYWAAVDDDGEVEFAVGSDDTDADRTEVNQYINDRLLNDKKKLRLVAMYTAPPAQAQDALKRFQRVLEAAESVVSWDWSDNDDDAVADITRLFDAVQAARNAMTREGE